MKTALYKVDITPQQPSYLSGQINRIARHTAVLDPLFCSALILDLNDERFALIGYDLLMLDESLAEAIRQGVNQATGIPQDHILAMASHTHAGPEVLEDGLFGIQTEAAADPAYRDFLIKASIQACEQAMDRLQEAGMHITTFEIEGLFTNRNDPKRPIDKTLRAILFRNPQGKPISAFINLACHPTILGPENTAISADLFGVLRSLIETKWGIPVLLSNGAEGDVSNRHTRLTSDVFELRRVSALLQPQIPDKPVTGLLEDSLIFRQKTFTFRTRIDHDSIRDYLVRTDMQLAQVKDADDIKLLKASARVLKDYLNRPELGELPITYSLLRLDRLILAFLPMELFSGHYLKLKAACPLELIVVGLSNTSIGYLVDKEAMGQTYESMTSPIPYPEIERFLKTLILDLRELAEH